MCVGFADLVGFTAQTQELEHQLAEVVGRFETIAFDVVADHGGRVVKMIGDEVMFLHDEPCGRRAGPRHGRPPTATTTTSPTSASAWRAGGCSSATATCSARS